MKKRDIVQQLEELRCAVAVARARLGDADLAYMASRMEAIDTRVAELGAADPAKIGRWCGSMQTEVNNMRLELTNKLSEIGNATTAVVQLRARIEAMRGDVTLDAAAAQRLTYAVGQFDARLTRLERLSQGVRQPSPPKPRRKRAGKPAGAENGTAEPETAT